MKRLISAFFTGVLALVLSVTSAFSQAAESAEEFVEDASAKGLAEAFAQETLPTLEEHLQMAKKLAAAHGENQRRGSDMNQSQRSDTKKDTQRHSSSGKSSGKQSTTGAQAHS